MCIFGMNPKYNGLASPAHGIESLAGSASEGNNEMVKTIYYTYSSSTPTTFSTHRPAKKGMTG